MQGRILYVAAIVAVALVAMAAPASATHVQCGDTITVNTTLDSNVQCVGQADGLYIGADDVKLQLAGYTISTDTSGGTGISTVNPGQVFARLDIRGGGATLQGFSMGVDLYADDSAVRKVSIPGAEFHGIMMDGDRNYAHRNTVVMAPPGWEPGIQFYGDDAYAYGNSVTGSGIEARGERPRLVLSNVANCGFADLGVSIRDYSGFAVVNRNTVSYCRLNIYVDPVDGQPGGAQIRLNHTTGGRTGLKVVDDAGAIIGRNVAVGAEEDGISAEFAGMTVQNNEAYNNGIYGIWAVEGTIDGGGNLASGNGDGSTPQCLNVACSTP